MNDSIQNLLLFTIGEQMLAMRMEVIEEVLPKSPATPIPRTAPFVRGIAAIRGRVMSVIDGGLRLGIPSMNDGHFIVCKVRGNLTAVTVERPLEAGLFQVKALSPVSTRVFLEDRRLPHRLFHAVWEIPGTKQNPEIRYVPEVNADQLVSDRMASQIESTTG